jgi:hypothetical protein
MTWRHFFYLKLCMSISLKLGIGKINRQIWLPPTIKCWKIVLIVFCIHDHPPNLGFTCLVGSKVSIYYFTLLCGPILSLNSHSIPSVRYEILNSCLTSTRYSLEFLVVEIYDDMCYVTGVLSWCRYFPGHSCRVLGWWHNSINYWSWRLN